MADPEIDGTRQHNFNILNFSKKMIIIGGTGYTGEIKKGIFLLLILFYLIRKMYYPCISANVGKEGDTLFLWSFRNRKNNSFCRSK